MVNKDLSNWIKSEVAKGYSEEQIVKSLRDAGYKEEDIKKSLIELFKDKILSYIDIIFKRPNLPVLILFLISYIFISYFFGHIRINLITLGVLTILILTSFVSNLYLSKKIHRIIAKLIIVIGFIFLLTWILSQHVIQYLFAIIVISYFQGLIYHYNSSKKTYTIEFKYLSIFISLIFTSTIIILGYLFYGYVIFSLFKTVPEYVIVLILSPLIILFITSYLLITKIIFIKFFGEFDYNSFFRFEKYPFKILNIFSSKTEDMKKTVIRSNLIIYISIILIGFIIVSWMGVKYANNLNKNNIEKYYFGFDNMGTESRYEVLLEQRGYSDIKRYVAIESGDGKLATIIDENELNKVKKMLYDCDLNLNCKEKEFNPNQNIEVQIPPYYGKGRRRIYFIAKNDTESILVFYPYLTEEERIQQVINKDAFEFKNLELKNMIVAQETNELWKITILNMKKSYEEIKINKNISWFEKLTNFYLSDIFNEQKIVIFSIVRLGLELTDYNINLDSTIYEYEWVKKNEVNNTIFYNGAKNRLEHIKKLNENVEYFYKEVKTSKEEDNEETQKVAYGNIGFLTANPDSLFGKTNSRIFSHSNINKVMTELGEEQSDLRNNYPFQRIEEEYQKNLEEKDQKERIIRLKILETKMADLLIQECNNPCEPYKPCQIEEKNCKMEIINTTKNPRFCIYLRNYDRTQCYIDYSLYDKDYCEKIEQKEDFNKERYEQCMNS